MITESESNRCLFCASPCSPTFTIIDGKLTRLKTEKRGKGKTKTSSSSSQFLEEEDNSLLANQLRVIFILKNILKINNEKLVNFLGKLDGDFNPEYWIQLCETCGAAVREYYDVFREVLRLQKKLTYISSELRTHIEETWEAHEVVNETGEEETEEASTNVWKEIRQEVLKQNEAETEPETTRTRENISSHGKGKKSTEILLEGDNNAEWNEEEGMLSLDVPDLASLKQILGLDLESEESFSNRKVSIQSKNSKNQSNSNIDEDWEENFINSPAPSETPSNSQDFSKSSPTKTKTKSSSSSSSSLALRKVKKKRKRPTHDKARFGGHSCDQCPFRAMRAPSLEAHRKLHNPDSNVKAVACPICKWVLPPTRLYIHNKHHHPSELPENEDGKKQRAGASHSYYKCPECGALFIFLVYLRSHMKLHEKGEGITCTDCGWVTTNLTRHMSHWHPPEGSWRAEQRSRLSSAYRIRECTFLKIENGSKPDGESGNNDD